MTPQRGHAKHGYPPLDHYTEVTNRIVAALEAGTPPWRKPWNSCKTGNPAMPRNAVTGRHYRGVNVVTLAASPLALTSGDPRWATYKQTADRGWQVKKGACGTTAYFFKRIEVPQPAQPPEDDSQTKTRGIAVLRAFTLFHASQIERIPEFTPATAAEAPWRADDVTEIIIGNTGVAIEIGGDRAFYTPGTDKVHMPPRRAFRTAAAWSSTILHELAHATSHASRLDRDLGRSVFGSPDYAREELRAELAQVMVCAELGIAECEFSNSAAYVKSWAGTLRSDRKEIFRAAADAQRIADYLLARHPDYAARHRNTVIAAEDPPAAPDALPARRRLAA
jgi:antirestriction protein ArdC